MDIGTLRVMQKRVVDMAGCLPGVKVSLNGQQVPVRSFQEYVNLFAAAHNGAKPRFIAGPAGSAASGRRSGKASGAPLRCEVAVMLSDQGFQQVSFVNGMATPRGGSHVNWVADQINRGVAEHINSKHKGEYEGAQRKGGG